MTDQTAGPQPLELATDPGTGVTLSVPPGWSRVELDGFQLALAADESVRSAADGSLFRPNITVLVSTVAPGTDVAMAATQAVAGLITLYDDGRLLAYDVWPGPDGVEGRRLVSAYRDGSSTICVTQWVFVHEGLATTVTASLPVSALPAGDVLAQAAVAGLRLPVPGPAASDLDPMTGIPPERPRPDAYLSSIGEPYEDIAAIGPASPYLGTGPLLARGLVEMLATAAANTRPGRPPRLPRAGRRDPALTTLVTAELATQDGHLTETGTHVASALAAPAARLRVESARGRTPLTLEASVRDGRAVVVATASPADLAEEPRGEAILRTATQLRLDWVDVSYLPLLIASWIGLSPAWSLVTAPELLPHELLVRRVDDPALPPPSDADRNLRHVWEQPWFLWTLRAAGVEHGRVAVNAGRAGQFMLLQAPDPGQCRFTVMPAANAWTDLVGFVWQAVTA